MDKLKSPVVPENSPFINPPKELSRKQIQVLDGLRYSAEMSIIAYERLFNKLHIISSTEPSTRDIAETMLDAWSVVDAVHRFVDLARNTPGLRHGHWLKKLEQRTSNALKMRDDVQHQIGDRRLEQLAQGGQIWGVCILG